MFCFVLAGRELFLCADKPDYDPEPNTVPLCRGRLYFNDKEDCVGKTLSQQFSLISKASIALNEAK